MKSNSKCYMYFLTNEQLLHQYPFSVAVPTAHYSMNTLDVNASAPVITFPNCVALGSTKFECIGLLMTVFLFPVQFILQIPQ